MKEQKGFLNLKKLSEISGNSDRLYLNTIRDISSIFNKPVSSISLKHIENADENIKKLKIYFIIKQINKLNFKINKTIVHFSKSEKIMQKYYESNNHLLIEKVYYELCINENPNLKIAEYINSILEKNVINPFQPSYNSEIPTYKVGTIDIKKLLFSGYFSDLALRNLARSMPLSPEWRSLIHEYFFYKTTI